MKLEFLDQWGNIYLAGRTLSSTDISSDGFQNNYSNSGEDAFLVQFDSYGNRYCATYYGAGGADHCQGVITDSLGNVYIVGSSNSLTGISSEGFQNEIGGDFDAYLVKFSSCSGVGIDENVFSNTILLYPNPATTTLSLTTEQTLKNAELKIMNAIGQQVSHPLSRGECASLSAGKGCVLDISSLPPGLYYLTLQSEEGVATKKFEVIR